MHTFGLAMPYSVKKLVSLWGQTQPPSLQTCSYRTMRPNGLKNRVEFTRTKKLFNNSRYIDYLITLNDGGEFENTHKEIYPPELVLNKENQVDTSANFLDLSIEVVNNTFDYKLFDKRDDFPFDIVRFPYKCSTIPRRMFFSTFQAEILRICRATVQFSSFLTSCKPFLARMLRQGATKQELKHPVKNIVTKHTAEFAKYDPDQEKIINEILNQIV